MREVKEAMLNTLLARGCEHILNELPQALNFIWTIVKVFTLALSVGYLTDIWSYMRTQYRR